MHPIGRRCFLSLAAGSTVAAFARTLKVVGVQLYTLRDVLPKDPYGILHAVEQVGYREAEVVADNLDEIWPSLKRTSLTPVSVHLNTELFMREQAKLPRALEDAQRRGFQYVVCPYIAPQDRGGVDVIRRLGETLNQAGEICRKSGLHLCYHNHAFEFEPAGNGTLLDVLLETIDPKLVSLELDIMWARVAGVDPVSVLKQYGNRIALMHLKNVAEGVEKRYDERVPRTAFREVGNGVIDIPAVLKAAARADVKHYFVEQDQTQGDPVQSLRESYQYLEKLNF